MRSCQTLPRLEEPTGTCQAVLSCSFSPKALRDVINISWRWFSTGGHHPMQEGEVFNTQYQVLHKLGRGAFATVWLCQDMRRQKQVAVKVLKSREGFADTAQDEVAFLRCVNCMKKKDLAGENIVCLLDDFRMIGENGFHILLWRVLGPSIRCLMGNYRAQGLPLPFVKKSLQQVLAGLHFLHECCRIIHADIKPENILLCGHSKRLQRLLMATLHCDQGTEGKLKGAGGDLGNQLEESDLMSIEVKIADLGSACWTYKPFSKEIQTQPYRALEVLLGLDYGTPADIWSTACLVGLGTALCLPGRTGDNHVARIIELLGRIPSQTVFSWNKSTQFFSKPGALLRLSRLCPRSLPGILADRHGWTRQEAAAFAAFLLPALHYAPERRASAAQSLRHAWIAAP
uniref:non-specific serine/threonine protein kinase n=1 Tax=Taeniopygia guttata TaxID=59729 RepID=H0ZDT1_TAEGU